MNYRSTYVRPRRSRMVFVVAALLTFDAIGGIALIVMAVR